MPLPPVSQLLGIPFIELPSVDSTNNYALAQIHANLARPGTCYFTHEQTAGKGQRGKSWATEKDANIALSIVLKPASLQPFQQFLLSACVAVATQQFLARHAGEKVMIKWPNDLYWRDKKMGGILIENIIGKERNGNFQEDGGASLRHPSDVTGIGSPSSEWKWAIIGIGININQTQFPTVLKNPVSLKQITGKKFNIVELARELCQSLDYSYRELLDSGASRILDAYNQVLYKKNELVKFRKGNRNFRATVKAASETGQIILQTSLEERFDFGEVEWLL